MGGVANRDVPIGYLLVVIECGILIDIAGIDHRGVTGGQWCKQYCHVFFDVTVVLEVLNFLHSYPPDIKVLLQEEGIARSRSIRNTIVDEIFAIFVGGV